MTDITSRSSLRIPRRRRGDSTASSARSSVYYDDYRPLPPLPPEQPIQTAQPGSHGPHGLRTVDSRFSLNEHFAASRREYEFGFDDASSVLFDHAAATEDEDDEDGFGDRTLTEDDFALLGDDGADAAGADDLASDCYDTLCLPRGAHLSPDQIRRAYYRLFLLFYPASYPLSQRPVAGKEFARVQHAFETLVDPERRARYDVELAAAAQADDADVETSYDAAAQDAIWQRLQSGVWSSSDLGVRYDATGAALRRSSDGVAPVRPLDFALGQSMAVESPAFEKAMRRSLIYIDRLLQPPASRDHTRSPAVEVTAPVLSVHGAVYGIVEDMFSVPMTVLSDRYQPLLPSTAPRQRLLELVETKLSPLVSLRLRQEVRAAAPDPEPSAPQWEKTDLELGFELLPEQALTARLHHCITLPDAAEPVIIETSVRSSRHLQHLPPRLALGARRRLRHGTAFIRADSGDWMAGRDQSYRFFTGGSSWSRGVGYAEFPLSAAPSLELGFARGGHERTSAPCFQGLLAGEGGMTGLDQEAGYSKEGSWTASVAASFGVVAGYVRYSRDLKLGTASPVGKPLSRVELEVCSSTLQDRYLALRNLWPVGRFARLGLEFGVSSHNLHVSLYWSRLGQRLALPVLIAPSALASPPLLFLCGALPFAGLGLTHLLRRRQHIQRPPNSSRPATQAAIARRRREADRVTGLLAAPADARQRHRAGRGGLVVLSAKFGVQEDGGGGWTGEEVADVTIALAALVESDDMGPDGGDAAAAGGADRLVIPQGVRKGRIPGFWDPAPGREKVLHVRYVWKGREATVEVRGREGLVLPPP